MQDQDQTAPRRCVECSNPLSVDAVACPKCGHDYRNLFRSVRRRGTAFPEIGGAVIIASGAFQILLGFVMITNTDLIRDAEAAGVAYAAAAVALIMVSPIAIYGGISAMLRRNLTMATIAAVLTSGGASIASVYGIGIYGMALGLVGLILIVASKDDFEY